MVWLIGDQKILRPAQLHEQGPESPLGTVVQRPDLFLTGNPWKHVVLSISLVLAASSAFAANYTCTDVSGQSMIIQADDQKATIDVSRKPMQATVSQASGAELQKIQSSCAGIQDLSTLQSVTVLQFELPDTPEAAAKMILNGEKSAVLVSGADPNVFVCVTMKCSN